MPPMSLPSSFRLCVRCFSQVYVHTFDREARLDPLHHGWVLPFDREARLDPLHHTAAGASLRPSCTLLATEGDAPRQHHHPDGRQPSHAATPLGTGDVHGSRRLHPPPSEPPLRFVGGRNEVAAAKAEGTTVPSHLPPFVQQMMALVATATATADRQPHAGGWHVGCFPSTVRRDWILSITRPPVLPFDREARLD